MGNKDQRACQTQTHDTASATAQPHSHKRSTPVNSPPRQLVPNGSEQSVLCTHLASIAPASMLPGENAACSVCSKKLLGTSFSTILPIDRYGNWSSGQCLVESGWWDTATAPQRPAQVSYTSKYRRIDTDKSKSAGSVHGHATHSSPTQVWKTNTCQRTLGEGNRDCSGKRSCSNVPRG